jgi:RNA polymerase sigma-70 factor (ECF subfamily)
MTAPAPDTLDLEVRALIDAGDVDRATADTLRRYGPELIGWLCSILPNEADAHEAFSWMSEELWKSLVRWDGRCSMRTWCYMIARHASVRIRAQPRRLHEVLVSQVPSIAHAVTHVWNTSRANAVRAQDVYGEIRRMLDDDDQTLLVLRVDRSLSWRDIAHVLLGEGVSADEVTTKAASLRKQFERVKERLRTLAAQKLRE